jgi:hypothetical protein
VFDKYDIERLSAWKGFREALEDHADPLLATAELWANAPFVNSFIDDAAPASWPGPWELVMGKRFDDLAIALGMLYTLSLTRRFAKARFDLYKLSESSPRYVLVVNNGRVLNLEYRGVVGVASAGICDFNKIYTKKN